MKHMGRFLMFVFALTLVLSGIAAAQDKPKAKAVDLKILPPAVLKAFKTAYPNAVITGASKETENGVTLYEVESVDGKLNRDLLYTADGKATEIEETIAPENLPASRQTDLGQGISRRESPQSRDFDQGRRQAFRAVHPGQRQNNGRDDRSAGQDRQVS